MPLWLLNTGMEMCLRSCRGGEDSLKLGRIWVGASLNLKYTAGEADLLLLTVNLVGNIRCSQKLMESKYFYGIVTSFKIHSPPISLPHFEANRLGPVFYYLNGTSCGLSAKSIIS
jgi:hypothetical protein